jgi:hypothetical protein
MAAVINRMTTGVEIQALEDHYASQRPVFIASSSMPRLRNLPPRVSRTGAERRLGHHYEKKAKIQFRGGVVMMEINPA